MDKALARLNQTIDYLKDNGKIHKQQDIADALGMGKARVSESLKGKEGKFTEFFLNRFADAYSEYINKDWLLTGEGEMTKVGKDMRPHVEQKAAAGFMDNFSRGEKGEDFRQKIPFISEYDFTIEVSGDSMEPEIKNGDILACRMISDRLNPPIGKVCVIDSPDGFAVKVIKSVKPSGEVTLHSFNNKYSDYTVEGINHTAVVVGFIRPCKSF